MEILCERVNKSFSARKALDSVSFHVCANSVAILGLNAAGKSTLLRIFATILKPDGGTISINGLDILRDYRKLRQIMAFVPETSFLIEELSAVENIRHFSTLRKVRVDPSEIIQKFSISPAKKPARTLSKGMKQRLMIAIALIGKPELLILDEPTTGLDREAKMALIEILSRMRNQGTSIILSTHSEKEVREIADSVVVLEKGKVLLYGSTDQVLKDLT